MIVFWLLFVLCYSSSSPNVLLIVVDDVGQSDVGFNGGRLPTPYLDSLAKRGVILDNYYTHPVCTPSRAALLTGRYSHNVGLVGPLLGSSLCGIPNDTSTIAEELRARGYATHLVGKWHLGHSKWSFTPLERGFDTHFGIFGAATDHWTKFLWNSYDFRRQRDGFFDESETHSSKLLEKETLAVLQNHAQNETDRPFFLMLSFLAAHAPLQADPDHLAPCSHIQNGKRRKYCGLIVSIDQTVKKVVTSLEALGVADNTLIIFTTDNGGMPHEGGLPYPYRGTKLSTFEGGARGPAFVVAPKGWLNQVGYRYSGLMHISDWFPTILHFVDQKPHLGSQSGTQSGSHHSVHDHDHGHGHGDVDAKHRDGHGRVDAQHGSTSVSSPSSPKLIGARIKTSPNYKLDGFNLWESISNNGQSPRTDVVETIDIFLGQTSYRSGKWKIVMGDPHDQEWYREPEKWVVSEPSPFDMMCELMERLAVAIRGATTGYVLQEAINEMRISANHYFGYHLGPEESRSASPMPNGTWLFDLEADPEERRNLYNEHPEIASRLARHLDQIKANLPKQCNWKHSDLKAFETGGSPADPKYPNKRFQGPWLEEDVDLSTVETVNVFELLKHEARVGLSVLLGGTICVITVISCAIRQCFCRSKNVSKRKKE